MLLVLLNNSIQFLQRKIGYMKNIVLILFCLSLSARIFSQDLDYDLKTNIHYYSDSVNQLDDYILERCVLDIYYPKSTKNFATVIWFHGGGLTVGKKSIPASLKGKGIAVIAVNYRLNPKVKAPKYIEDAAAAVAWTFKNISNFGGDSSLIFISGHSAGGYLSSMVGLDKRWLMKYHIDANRIAGLIPFSGNMITHMTIRQENGIAPTQPVVDELAPLYYVRADAPPLLLITGDRELELFGRYEENAYMMRMMRVAGHKDTRIFELDGYGHDMVKPALSLLLEEIQRITNSTHRNQETTKNEK